MPSITNVAPRDFTSTDSWDNDQRKLPLDPNFIFSSDIPPGPRLVYIFIVSKSDKDDLDRGVTVPMETIGRTLNISYATVHKHIQRLVKLGFLRIEQDRAGHNTYFPIHYWSL